MAYLEMYNDSENKSHHHHHHCAPMSPRISFSNDFVDTQQSMQQERISSEAPASSDFEFSVSNYSMMTADELFFKGKLLPFKDNGGNQMQRTLREELLVGDDDDNVTLRPPKGSISTRWKGFLSLKRNHIGSRKADKSEGISSSKRYGFVQQETHVTKTSQDILGEAGSSSSCRDADSHSFGRYNL
ncbi:B3 domain-containing protein [Hibiscus syriacus]|uniref:B3 domain-containing protein n=1 Tax=Hibiscus syriacus TaxID=106335 RepID=A0A6A3AJT4_HIBSY|nr:B3 domain-containing protein [Hibiscus syriacus]